jgi:hypothetical protein
MTDIGKHVKVVKDLIKELDTPSEGLNNGQSAGGKAQQNIFKNVLESQQQTDALNRASEMNAASVKTGRVIPNATMDKVLKDIDKVRQSNEKAIGHRQKIQSTQFSKSLEGLIDSQDKMSKIMDLALSGRQFSPSDLLAMQAGIYRFSQELDLVSKVVEKATGSIKQTLNTQV